jgi:hypothetical protein
MISFHFSNFELLFKYVTLYLTTEDFNNSGHEQN